MENNNIDLRIKLERLPEEQLQEMLQTEVAKEVPDDDLVLLLLNILEERDKEKPLELSPKEQAAWKKYRKSVKCRGRKSARPLGRIAVVAASLVAVFAIAFAAMPQEAQAGSLFDVLARWTDSLFAFFDSGSDSSLVNYTYQTNNAGLQQLRDTVVEHGGTERAIPMWLPEGSELVSIEVDEVTHMTNVSALFQYGDKNLVIKVDIYETSVPREFYKNLDNPREWEILGNTHYIVQNREQWSAAWAKENTECFITLECREDVLTKILRSIYVMEAE